jgi:hypothetical protein
MNCRYVESGAFLDDALQEEFGNYVEILLHTDGKDEKWRESSVRNRKLQKERFGSIALPYYAILDPVDEEVLWESGGVFTAEEFLEIFRTAREKLEGKRE